MRDSVKLHASVMRVWVFESMVLRGGHVIHESFPSSHEACFTEASSRLRNSQHIFAQPQVSRREAAFRFFPPLS